MPLKSSIQLINPVIGSPDAYLCGVLITANSGTLANPLNEENWLMGGFWLKPSTTTTGIQRSKLQHDQAQMLQQYLAAVLNNHLFGSSPPGGLAQYRSDYCSGNDTAIQHDIGILDTFNTQGDTSVFTPGASATPQTSQAQADLDTWNGASPSSKTAILVPGQSDEDTTTTLALTKTTAGNSPPAANTFTLTATCTNSPDGKKPCGTTTKSGAGGFSAAPVSEGTYTLSESPGGGTPSFWTCTQTNAGTLGTRFFLAQTGPGTASLSIEQGAVLTCGITNTF